ncbi:MAG TPA: lytic transglycosylase domain-containing protein [Anaeromyxobacteraceae bacterium]
MAVAVFGAVAGFPRAAGGVSAHSGVETWISSSCAGERPCARLASARWLAALIQDRMPEAEGHDHARLAAAIAEEAEEARLDPLFVLAVIEVESGFDQEAVSRRGAQGLMQLKPSTFRSEAERGRLAADPADPVLNVRAGIRYLRRCLDAFRQDTELALMAYNAGPQRISRLRREEGGVPERYRAYPRRVRAEWERLRGEVPPRVALAEGQAPSAVPR